MDCSNFVKFANFGDVVVVNVLLFGWACLFWRGATLDVVAVWLLTLGLCLV